jgi:ankyrin repeat protein
MTVFQNSISSHGSIFIHQERHLYDEPTPILLACLKRSLRFLVKVLIELGAHVNKRNKDGATALFMVVGIRMSPKIMKLLLQNGAELDDRCSTSLLSHGKNAAIQNKTVLIALECIRQNEERRCEK